MKLNKSMASILRSLFGPCPSNQHIIRDHGHDYDAAKELERHGLVTIKPSKADGLLLVTSMMGSGIEANIEQITDAVGPTNIVHTL